MALVGLATGLGFSLLVFIAGGVLLDNLFHSTPVFLLAGVFFAMSSVVVFLWKIIASTGRKP
jgi:hypothetical protein